MDWSSRCLYAVRPLFLILSLILSLVSSSHILSIHHAVFSFSTTKYRQAGLGAECTAYAKSLR